MFIAYSVIVILTKHFGRVVKAADLRSAGQESAWVRTPQVLIFVFLEKCVK